MKGYHNNHSQGKRRWRCLVIGVLFLVVLSMLVPLVFLLGLYHNGFHSTGHPSDPRSSSSSSPTDQSSHVKQLIENFAPTLPSIHQVCPLDFYFSCKTLEPYLDLVYLKTATHSTYGT
ncbi:hypothetical protein OIU79_012548 [Salix purpurea]|uniref:Uncharacterized protein n=1 Tax=Salix purpurea TaxID=77065 RepID=A0A9Q0Q3F7_SALPP|nr:hypothetical protein OIU79_012548 [Salix purpurea]